MREGVVKAVSSEVTVDDIISIQVCFEWDCAYRAIPFAMFKGVSEPEGINEFALGPLIILGLISGLIVFTFHFKVLFYASPGETVDLAL